MRIAVQTVKRLPIMIGLTCFGCATTGDPNSGGLFGWREQQARQRQETLHQEIETTEAATQQQSVEYEYLKGAKTDVAGRVAELKQVFQVLVAENAELNARITALVAEESLAQRQLTQLRGELPSVPTPRDFELESPSEQQEWVTRLRQQNLRMRQALDL